MTNYEKFENIFRYHLGEAVRTTPTRYSYTIEQVPAMAKKLVAGMSKGNTQIGSPTIKTTCRQLNIKLTPKAIKEYLNT